VDDVRLKVSKVATLAQFVVPAGKASIEKV
jgi:hypothetical protein